MSAKHALVEKVAQEPQVARYEQDEHYEVADVHTDPVRPRNRNRHVGIWTLYAVVVVVLLASSLLLSGFLHEGAFIWPLTIFGAVLIGVLISGAAIPHLRDRAR